MYKVSFDNENWLSQSYEIVSQLGFCLLTNVFDHAFCDKGIAALDNSYSKIIKEIGLDRLGRAGEVGVCRAPMSYDPFSLSYLKIVAYKQLVVIL